MCCYFTVILNSLNLGQGLQPSRLQYEIIVRQKYIGKQSSITRIMSHSASHAQWRSQPDNLVPLCKFQIIIIIHFFRN